MASAASQKFVAMQRVREATQSSRAEGQSRSWVDFADCSQAVYGLRVLAPQGCNAVSADGRRFTQLIYVGASGNDFVDERILASRENNATVSTLRKKGWKTELLFVDRRVPVGTEDLATTAMRLYFRGDPLTLVLGGVTAALAAEKYSFTRRAFERLSGNSALGACLKCDYNATAARPSVHWGKCKCDGEMLPPEEIAHMKAVEVSKLQEVVSSLQKKNGEMEERLREAALKAADAEQELDQLRAEVMLAKASQERAVVMSSKVRDAGAKSTVPPQASRSGKPYQQKGIKRPAAALQTSFKDGAAKRVPMAVSGGVAKRPASVMPQWRRKGAVPTVLIHAEHYTTLAWYFGPDLNGWHKRQVYNGCSFRTDAARLVRGDQNTLRSQGFVADGKSKQELMLQSVGKLTVKASASRCSASPSRTASGYVEVRRPLKAKEPNVMWKLTALDNVGRSLRELRLCS